MNWSDLKGVDDLIRALEAKIALLSENGELRETTRLQRASSPQKRIAVF